MVVVTEIENIVWGQSLEAGPDAKKVEFQGEKILELTMAALDTSVECSEFVPIFVHTSETSKHLLCTLSKSQQLQQPLKLIINAGENVQFSLNCEKGKVCLTGYFLGDLGGGCGHDHDAEGEHEHSDNMLDKRSLEALLRGHDGEDDDSDDDDEDDDDEEDDDEEEDDDDDDDDEEEEEEEVNNGKRKSTDNGKRKSTDNGKSNQSESKKLKEEIPKLVPTVESKGEPAFKTIVGGVQIKDTKEGKGPEAKKGKWVHVYYTGKLKNGKKFDSCVSGKPFKFQLGKGDVIKGWDVGFENMKVGGKRTIVVPPNMGYGNKKMGPDLPANSTLVFDVELKSVN